MNYWMKPKIMNYRMRNGLKLQNLKLVMKSQSQTAMGGIKFEKIVSIKILDRQQVYDLMIENTHNFIANDIVAHNTFVTGFVNFTNNTAFNQTLYSVNGNLGIGTTGPASLLTVQGTFNATSSSTQMLLNSNGDVFIDLRG